MNHRVPIVAALTGLMLTATAASAYALDIRIDTGGRASGALEIAVLLALVTLAPAILILLTSFTRIVIVLSLLRQALGLQQTPPNMVITGLALFLTMLVMAPTWERIRTDAVDPYMAGRIAPREAADLAEKPLREFMLRQTRKEDVAMARELLARGNLKVPAGDPRALPFYALVPAFVSSELTSAFRVGFLIYLPFLAIDLLTSSVLMALGMFMLPPAIVSIPLKLLIFVLASGWPLLLRNLAGSFN